MTTTISPQLVGEEPSALCSLGPRPLLIQGFLLQHLRRHFAQPSTIEHANLRDYLWRAQLSDRDRASLMIESVTRWDPNIAGVRPAILLRRNDWQQQRLGIGDKMMTSSRTDGWDRYSVMMAGSHTIFCLAREAGEVETLAYELLLELQAFAQLIRERLNLLRFGVVQLGRPQRIVESRSHFGVPLTVGYVHTQDWTIRKHTPVIGSIELDLGEFTP